MKWKHLSNIGMYPMCVNCVVWMRLKSIIVVCAIKVSFTVFFLWQIHVYESDSVIITKPVAVSVFHTKKWLYTFSIIARFPYIHRKRVRVSDRTKAENCEIQRKRGEKEKRKRKRRSKRKRIHKKSYSIIETFSKGLTSVHLSPKKCFIHHRSANHSRSIVDIRRAHTRDTDPDLSVLCANQKNFCGWFS